MDVAARSTMDVHGMGQQNNPNKPWLRATLEQQALGKVSEEKNKALRNPTRSGVLTSPGFWGHVGNTHNHSDIYPWRSCTDTQFAVGLRSWHPDFICFI